MSRCVMIVAFVAGLSALPAAASAQPVRALERAETPVDASTGDPNRRICKASTATGTRLAKAKICKTAREWAEKQYEHKQQLERVQTRPNLPDKIG